MIDAMLRAHDKRTGLITSPHVYDIRELIQFNGLLIPEKHFIAAANKVIHVTKSLSSNEMLSYPRLMPTIGFVASSEIHLDYLVVETGMGGRYDTSNTITRPDKYVVLTQIGLDNTDTLGTTYQQIATEKAGVVHPECYATALRQDESVNAVFENKFKEMRATVSWVTSTESYMIDNLLLALDAVRSLSKRDNWEFDEEKAKLAAHKVYIPGRFEQRSYRNQTIVLDGAHNPQKLSALAWRLTQEDKSSCTVVLAQGDQKDIESGLRAIKPVAKRVICTEFFSTKPNMPIHAVHAEKLAHFAKECGIAEVIIIKNPHEAVKTATAFPEPVVITGSFYLLGEIDNLF